MNVSNRNLVLDVYMLLILLGLVLVGVGGSHVKPSTPTSNIPFHKDQKAYHIQPSKNWMNDPNVVKNALVAHPDRFHFLWKSTTPLIASTQYRTAYHFQPPKNWMNDPNGPMYYNGYYHLFYQYNPHSAVWGDIVWGHSVSTDLVNWVPVEPAIVPSDSFDAKGCWSGSATILPDNRPVILYTGADAKNRQVQNIAFPTNISDPLLREWTKPHYNPVIEPPFGIKPTNFRDPTTAWKGPDGHWRIAVGSTANNTGLALLYKSKDFTRWTKVTHPLHSTEGGGMWECPDFFPIANGSNTKHVLKVSSGNCFGIANCDQYTIGTYLLERDVYVPNNGSREGRYALRLDYGKFYASKSFFDWKMKRRIVWGWSAELDETANDVEKSWSGIQTIPRVLKLDESGEQLVQWPIKELESLRRKQFSLQNLDLMFGETLEIKGINASQADIELEFQVSIGSMKATDEPFNSSWLLDPQNLCTENGASVKGGFGPFGLLTLASKDLQEHTAVFFRVFKHQGNYVTFMCSDQSRSSLRSQVSKVAYGGFVNIDLEKTNGTISLRSLIDHSVVESFGGEGKTCITSRVYPATLSGGRAYLYVFNNGTQTVTVTTLRAWEMATANIN